MAEGNYRIAVDIGTTTLVCALTDEKGGIVAEISAPNKGSAYGADVMSRIEAAAAGKLAELGELMRAQLSDMISELAGDGHLDVSSGIRACVAVAGNTAMLHILRGYECGGLGKYPYTPVSLETEELTAKELFETGIPAIDNADTFIFPGISGFVGADIVSGLYSMGIPYDDLPRPLLFVDLGTNGEMALVRGRGEDAKITVCSTAAGPVFEGAGVRFGMPAGPGAISEVYISAKGRPGGTAVYAGSAEDPSGVRTPEVRYRVINGETPRGICGSGILEAVSELARTQMIDRTGLLFEPWFSDGVTIAGNVRIFQEDIRAVQLAKAAIRAGTESLPLSCGIRCADIAAVLVAGAFGRAVNFSRLAPLGMFNKALSDKCRAVGNTSLAGAARLASEIERGHKKEAMSHIRLIADSSEEISLANRQDFKALYMSMMNF